MPPAAAEPAAPRPRRGRVILIAAVALGLLGSATVVAGWAGTTRPSGYSFFATAAVSGVPTDSDTAPVELGLRFTSSSDGTLTAVRFLKATGAGDTHPVSVWSDQGQKLATVTTTSESRSGWQQVGLSTPISIQAGRRYVVSYHTTRYRASQQFFTRPVTAGPLSTAGVAGVYAYGAEGFPTKTWQATNYWVDVVFTPASGGSPTSAAPRPTGVPTPGASLTPSAGPTGTPPAAPASPGGAALSLPRVPWEGGPAYYGNFSVAKAAGWAKPTFFPIAVWYEGTYTQHDIDLDKAAGLNTYMQLTESSNLPLIKRNGMSALTREQLPGHGTETTGWRLSDEVDMWGKSGSGTWTGRWPGEGKICAPADSGCGPDIQRKLSAQLPSGDGRLRHANYGKGVVFWESDQEAAAFVNDYTTVVSNDIYWYTDPNVCYSSSEGPSLGITPATCRRAANYGLTMDVMRKLDGMDGRRQPIYNFVEVGHPSTDDSTPSITGNQVAGAVMSSVIHEARGIIYFNHNFGGPCKSQHVLRDCGVNTTRPKVAETNARITALAPVLNTQSLQWRFNPGLDTMLKAYGDAYYIFAMPGRTGGTGTQKLTLPPGMAGAKAEVLFENRAVPVTAGAIQDSFAEEFSYHIYKITP